MREPRGEPGLRRRFRRLAALVVAALGALAVVAPAPAQAASGTWITMFSDPGDWIGGGTPRVFDSTNASISVGGTPGWIDARVSGGTSGDYYDFEFAAPSGEGL